MGYAAQVSRRTDASRVSAIQSRIVSPRRLRPACTAGSCRAPLPRTSWDESCE
jgi:hypothetical protein